MATKEELDEKVREMNAGALRKADQNAMRDRDLAENYRRLAAHDRVETARSLSMNALNGPGSNGRGRGFSPGVERAWTKAVDEEAAAGHALAEEWFAKTGSADLLPGMTGESEDQKRRRALGERQAELRALGRTQGSILSGKAAAERSRLTSATDEEIANEIADARDPNLTEAEARKRVEERKAMRNADEISALDREGRQNLIDLKNRQAHEAINQQYGDLIRQGKASPFHALLAHQEQQRRYEEKTRLQGDYEKLKKEQDERQKAAQAAAEDLHKRMGSSTYAVFTALDRLNDPDLSDSERASTLSVAAAAAQKLGDQFVENKYGADSGYRSEVVKVEGENPATGRKAVGYEIVVKDRAGNPVMDPRTGQPLVMKLDADRARKAMEQHFGYEFRTDENGKTVFGVDLEGGNLQDGRFSFARQDFGSMQVGDRMFGGQYSAKTQAEMDNAKAAADEETRKNTAATDAHNLAQARLDALDLAKKDQEATKPYMSEMGDAFGMEPGDAKNAKIRAIRAKIQKDETLSPSAKAELDKALRAEADTDTQNDLRQQQINQQGARGRPGSEPAQADEDPRAADRDKFYDAEYDRLREEHRLDPKWPDERIRNEAIKAAETKYPRPSQQGGAQASAANGDALSDFKNPEGTAPTPANQGETGTAAPNLPGNGEQNPDLEHEDNKEDEAEQVQTKENAVSRILGTAWQEKNDAWMRWGQRGIGPGKRDEYVKYAATQMRDLLNGVKKKNFRNKNASDEILLTGSWSGERARALKSLFGKSKGFVKESEIDNVINILTKMIGE